MKPQCKITRLECAFFGGAEERFQRESSQRARTVRCLHERLGKGPSQCLDTAEALIEAAATIKRSTPPDFELSVDDKAIVNKSLAELIDWNFVAPTDGASASRETKKQLFRNHLPRNLPLSLQERRIT